MTTQSTTKNDKKGMTDFTKIFNGLLLTIIGILILMSLLAIATIHWTLIDNYSFSFSPKGINLYLTTFGQYKALFTVTIATIAAYFGFHRLKVATEANLQKIKQDRFIEWKSTLDIRFTYSEKLDKTMNAEFIRIRYKFFEKLYEINFIVSNANQLNEIFEQTFPADLIKFFESQNDKHINMGGVYQSNNHSYSFDAFQYLFLGCIDDNSYLNRRQDLFQLYIKCLPTDRIIDQEMYKFTLDSYVRPKI
jgi:hypothetical protein